MTAGCHLDKLLSSGSGGGGPPRGALRASAATSGSNLPTGYTVTLETGQSGTIGANASVTATGIPTGGHTVTLSGVPANCTVQSPNPLAVTVTAGATAQASFTISCGP